jgi:hypothetical protein
MQLVNLNDILAGNNPAANFNNFGLVSDVGETGSKNDGLDENIARLWGTIAPQIAETFLPKPEGPEPGTSSPFPTQSAAWAIPEPSLASGQPEGLPKAFGQEVSPFQSLEAKPYGTPISHLLRTTSVQTSLERLHTSASASPVSFPWTYGGSGSASASFSSIPLSSSPSSSFPPSPLTKGRSDLALQISLPLIETARRTPGPYNLKSRMKNIPAQTLTEAMERALSEEPVLACLTFMSVGLNVGRLFNICVLSHPCLFSECQLTATAGEPDPVLYSAHLTDLYRLLESYPLVFQHWLRCTSFFLLFCQHHLNNCYG